MTTYNKLVRDKIPTIIENDGSVCNTKILSKEDYAKELKIKMQEELSEYVQSETREESLEELADLIELIHACLKVHKASYQEVEAIRLEKSFYKGEFENRIFLIDVKK